MSRAPKRTPNRMAAVRAAREAGQGWRAAGRAAGVSAETARTWLAGTTAPKAQARAKATVVALSLCPAPRDEPTWAEALAPQPGRETELVDAVALRMVLGALDEANAFLEELEAAEAAGLLCASCPGREGAP